MLITGEWYNTTQLIVLNILAWLPILGLIITIISLIIYSTIDYNKRRNKMVKNKTITIKKSALIDSFYCIYDEINDMYFLQLFYTDGEMIEYEVTKQFYELITKYFAGF